MSTWYMLELTEPELVALEKVAILTLPDFPPPPAYMMTWTPEDQAALVAVREKLVGLRGNKP